jgi:Skp family chaperone for outer membrane proteins
MTTIKKCNTCKEEKSVDTSNWRRNKNSNDGFTSTCKSCLKIYDKEYRTLNKEKRNEVSKKSYQKNKEKRLKDAKKYYQENKEEVKRRTAEYRAKNPDKVKELNDNYLEKRKKLNKRKRKEDPLFKCKDNIRRRINGFLKKKDSSKMKTTQDILGCNWESLYKHLCSTFEENYGIGRQFIPWDEVHIDHIKPLKYAKNEEGIYKLNSHTNLQLLFAEDNLRKSDKDNYDF